MKKLKINKSSIPIASILLLSAFLNFFNIAIEGYANEYYSAGVKSMLMSFKNFFFVSFDPGAFVSIDKPPLGFWIQTASAAIFGFKGWSVILPQALAGVISVWLVYHLVKKSFNPLAGLVSAIVLAVTPVFVATSRNNTIDNLLILFLLLSCLAIMKAAEDGSLKYLMFCMILIGLGFNIKMLQAYMIIPAVYLVYLLSTKLSIKKRIIHLSLATVILVMISFSWAIVVDMVPASSRPYVGSSTDNTVMELIIGHNGLKRLGLNSLLGTTSDTTKTTNLASSVKKSTAYNQNQSTVSNENTAQGQVEGQRTAQGQRPAQGQAQGQRPAQGQAPSKGQRQGSDQSSSADVFRLFGNSMSDQISWLLPLALLGFIAAAIKEKLNFKFDNKRKLSLLLWISWLVPVAAYFSFTTGLFHNYYLSMLAPPIAALVGIGISALWSQYNEDGFKKWFLPVALIITGAVQLLILSYDSTWSGFLIPIIGVLCFVSALALILLQLAKKSVSLSVRKIVTTICMASLLIAPTFWSFTPMIYGEKGGMPAAGPTLITKQTGNVSASSNEKLITFLETNRKDEKYLVAVPNSQTMGSALILETGEPVMSLGGFGGWDSILTTNELETLVKESAVRYFLVENTNMGQGRPSQDVNAELTRWIKTNGVLVSEDLWKDSTTVSNSDKNNQRNQNKNNSIQLYDLNSISK